MSQIKFQKLINDFSPESLVDVLRSHDFFRIKQNLLLNFNDIQFKDFIQLGDFDLEDNTNIVVICARSLGSLNERASRKTQYDISKKILKNFQKSRAGIFVYYDSKGDFRISLIYADYVGIKVNYSTFRRFTYFVSKEQTNNTFFQQVASFNFTKFEELREMFSVEKVTKEFFKKYRDLFLDTCEDFDKNEVFQNIVVKTDISTSHDFVKKMMGQIVFLYFVQKKGWLGVRPNENWGSGDQTFLRTLFTICEKSNKNYFNDYLEPMFYEALASEKRGKDDLYEKLNCRIPFLNGGLFESIYKWEDSTIYIPNKTIGNLLDFFDQYNFTVDENTPSDQEISVDPEMLGKIFENLLEVKDRKDKGAFYTPREIVHYMCRESLIQHLVSENTAPEERIRKLFEIKDTDLSLLVEDEKQIEIVKRLPELKEISVKVDTSLRNIKIVDPAVGSGAFPMGMLNEISSVRYYLNSNFLHKLNVSEMELSLYDIKKETLENCIYAVDIEAGAVEIAKLRFWLALIVEYESNDSSIAPPTLPNLDYKIMQGNSLLEEYEGVKLFDEKIIQTINDKERKIDETKQKQFLIQKEYLGLHAKNELTPFKKVELDTEAKKLKEQLKKLNQVDKNDIEKLGLFDFNKYAESKIKADKLKSLQKQFFETNKKDKKEDIKKQIERLEWELIEATLKEEGKISELSKIEEFKKSKTKPFFLWRLHFADVFEQKGGFDIVIGNPPYIRHRDLPKKFKDELCSNYDVGNTTADIYCYFYELGYNLLSEHGTLTYITSNKWMRSKYGDKLRLLLKNKTRIEILIDLGGGQFETATVDTNIIVIKKEVQNGGHYLKYGQNIDDVLHKMKQSDMGENSFALIDQGVANIKASMEARGLKLKDWTSIKINYGILTGRNDTKNSVGEKEGVFIVDEAKRSELIKDNENSEVFIKPILRGKDVTKYGYNWRNKYLITTYYGTHKVIHNYPAIKKHLSHYKEILESRAQVIRGDHNWIELDQNPSERYLKEMEENKIIYPNINKEFAAAYDDSGILVNQKCFFITGNNLKYLLGVLNSKLNFFYFKLIGATLGNAGYDISKIFVNELPIIPADTNLEIKKEIEGLVNQVIDYKKQNKNVDTKNIESQIDQLVYKLYDLTPEEIEIVENSSKK